jgi:hypothetical protein
MNTYPAGSGKHPAAQGRPREGTIRDRVPRIIGAALQVKFGRKVLCTNDFRRFAGAKPITI